MQAVSHLFEQICTNPKQAFGVVACSEAVTEVQPSHSQSDFIVLILLRYRFPLSD